MLRRCQAGIGGHQGLGGVPRLGKKRHVAAEIGGLQRGQAVLAAAEEVAGSPQLQILLRDAEAVVGGGQRLQAAARLRILCVAEQDTVTLRLAASHAATQLVQLAQAEAVGVLHHHQRGVGHVHAHLHHRGGHQNVALAGGKGGHDLLLFPGLHAAVEQRHPQVGKRLFPQLPGVGGDGLALVGQVVLLPHQRADDEHLMPLGHLLADEGVEPQAVLLPHHEGVHRLSARRQLIDDRHVQITVDDQRQRAGNGRGRQHQQVGRRPLAAKGGALIHAEAVLLVGDDQPQRVVGHVLRQQGVGADAQGDVPGLQPL